MLLALLVQSAPAAEVIDLTKLVPSECREGEADEIVICGRAGESSDRLRPLPPPPDRKRVAGPGIGVQLAPNARANVYGETVGLEGGGQSNRAMVRLTVEF